MVLESLITAVNAEKHPKQMFFFGMSFAFIALFISFWVFQKYSSIVLVFLTTISAAPLIYNIIRLEEKKDVENYSQRSLLRIHRQLQACQ